MPAISSVLPQGEPLEVPAEGFPPLPVVWFEAECLFGSHAGVGGLGTQKRAETLKSSMLLSSR